MLELLHIENIAIIEAADIEFAPGFNALTGETGAGKSIVIDSLSAVLGQRTSRELIRTGAAKAFVSAAALLDAARHERFTLYLLDIMMPGLNGMDAAREIRGFDKAADIIFLTSSPGFAYDSYSVKALEYLLKPIRTKTLYPILDRLELRERRPQEALTLRTGGIIVRVPFSQLTYVEVNGKHLYFNLADGQVREVVGSMKEYEDALLTRPEFMRIHRSYIVNMLQIEELSPTGLRTFSGRELPVSRLLYPQLQKDYMKLLFAQREE